MTPSRTSYWHIEPVWVFYLVAALAVGVFLFGLIIHVSMWIKGIRRQKIPFSWRGISNLFVDGLLGRRIFRGDLAAGTMHLLIVWGFLGLFVGTVLISVDYWVYHFLKGAFYVWYSAGLEILGLMLTAGLIWSLIRRYLQRVLRLERRFEDLAVVVFLLLVVLSGFAVEGLRLAAQRPEWARWSFFGHWVSLLFTQPQSAQSAYPYLWWVHAFLSLGLIACIPYCKLFHILAAPTSIYLENQPLQAVPIETRGKDDEVFSYRDMIFLDACTRCGRCVEVCPCTGAGEAFSPRDFVVWARENLLRKYHPLNYSTWFTHWTDRRQTGEQGFDPQKVWHCTTCRACLDVCPVYVATQDAVRNARSKLIEEGIAVPSLLTQSLKNLYKYDNPWEATRKKRALWSQDLDIPEISMTQEAEGLCYFVGCTTSMDIRAQELARSFARILKHAQIPFGTLGKREPCCGDIARRAGEDGLFEKQMGDCVALFDQYSIREVVTSSPHCFNTFRNEYPAFQALKPPEKRVNFHVRHYTQLLRELVTAGSLRFEKPLHTTVTYHDPCYLGRHNQVFDAPRQVITAIPGVHMVEMAHNRANSLCCGGGGDRVWQEDLDADGKMAQIRIREAEATGAQILITACPLCLIMLEDARKTTGLEEALQVMDLNEFVVMALGLPSSQARALGAGGGQALAH
jgi:Fe-S oxidoreductase/nitrate reductase gamma subunit